MPKTSNEKAKSKKDRTRNDKGILLEQIVAMLHKEEGVMVKTNVYLSPKSNSKKRKREIDVLLTREVAGYPVRVAIQCKNYSKPISIGQIGEFKDLLEDVGIPVEHGIIVSINGYQTGAVDRAKELGIKTFVLEGLDETRLKAEIQDSFQFFVYLLPVIEKINVISEINNSFYSFFFWDDKEELCGSVMDLIVNSWRNGEIPSTLGEHELELELPQGWHQMFDYKKFYPTSMSAKVIVVGYLAEMQGKVEEYKLKETETNIVEKSHLQVNFDVLNNLIKSSHEEPIYTEDELKLLKKNTKVNVENRIRLPKIFNHNHLEPPSEKAFRFFMNGAENLTAEEIGRLPQPSFEEIEGNIFDAMQEPAAMGEPVFIKKHESDLIDVRLLTKQSKYGEIAELLPLLPKYPRKDFAEYLSIAHCLQGENLLEKLKQEIEYKDIFEKQAFSMFNKAIQLSSKPVDMCLSVGITLGRYKYYDKAILYFNRVIALQSQNKSARYYLAHTYFNMGNINDAVNVINETSTKVEDLPSKMILLAAKIFFTDEDYDNASRLLKYVWENDPKVLFETEYWHQFILDIYNKQRNIGNAFILCDMDFYYVRKYIKTNLLKESQEHLELAVKNLEDVHTVIKDEEVIKIFNTLLSKANEILDEVSHVYLTNLWKERLNSLG